MVFRVVFPANMAIHVVFREETRILELSIHSAIRMVLLVSEAVAREIRR